MKFTEIHFQCVILGVIVVVVILMILQSRHKVQEVVREKWLSWQHALQAERPSALQSIESEAISAYQE